MKQVTVRDRILTMGNDWTTLEQTWHLASIDPLIGEIWNQPNRQGKPVVLSTNLIIPAWNARSTIEACLAAIEQSTLQQRGSHLLQVVVVDDGSTDGTWEFLTNYRGSLNLLALQQKHQGQSTAMNMGLAHCHGEIIISCDADMLLNIWALEELVLRHQTLDNVLLVGFRGNIEPDSPVLQAVAQYDCTTLTRHAFPYDNRFAFDHVGWPENMGAETHNFRLLGYGRKLWMPSGEVWDLPRMVYGCLFSLRKSDFNHIGGFDERLEGWGFNDTLIGARAKALDLSIVPVISANGWHIRHLRRSPTQCTEGIINQLRYEELLNEPYMQNRQDQSAKRDRAENWYEWSGSTFQLNNRIRGIQEYTSLEEEAIQLFVLGDYMTAANRWKSSKNINLSTILSIARSLRMGGHPKEAIESLKESTEYNSHPDVLVEYSLSLAAMSEFTLAHDKLVTAFISDPENKICHYILNTPMHNRLCRAKLYANQGNIGLAQRDCQAALIQHPWEREAILMLASFPQQST